MASPPIAIVGMACRFAGGVDSPEKLWKLCAEGRSGWSEVPDSRFNVEGVYHPNAQKTNSMNVRGGHFLSEDPAYFDANFFGLSSEIASVVDPQFRLQLESTYEAFESAGLTLQDVAGSNTSVFAGAFFRDYAEANLRDPENLPRYHLLGIGSALAANRLSHFYDLRGPSMTIDTGCSTTLTAFHQACQSLKSNESDMAVVGGGNVILNPDMSIVMSSLTLLSPDGKSFAFDSRANGYGRGEGSATVVLKRLDEALRDGDPVRAVVQQTAANQDGRTETITTPSGQAQEDLIRDCYRKAGLDPKYTALFEAHGTGTPTGDPIEAKSVGSVFKDSRADGQHLRIGSVKTNIGHTETASGLASIIKVALSLEHGQIPPSINYEKPNPSIDLDGWKLKIPTELETWPEVENGIRRASVNNFGYGGANAHAILESFAKQSTSRADCQESRDRINGQITEGYAPISSNISDGHLNGDTTRYASGTIPEGTTGFPMKSGFTSCPSNRPRVFVLSAKDEQAVEKMAVNLRNYLETTDRVKQSEMDLLDDLAYTLGQRRTRFQWVSAFSAPSVSDVTAKLHPGTLKATKARETRPKLGFVFTGQGAQWAQMGMELLDVYPVFRESLVESERMLKEFGCAWSLMKELARPTERSRVGEQQLSMPICVVIQIALIELLSSWDITPTAITSHSSGEIASAFAAGALSKRSAIGIGFARGQFVPQSKGGMIAVGLGHEDCGKYISRVMAGKLVAACINSPTSTTISGDAAAVDEIEGLLKADGVFARRLRVSTAYHSHHIAHFSEAYETWIHEHVEPQRPAHFASMDDPLDSIFASPTLGRRILSARELLEPLHWARSLSDPVQFVDAVEAMCLSKDKSSLEVDYIVEIGPHPALSGPLREITSLPEFQCHKVAYSTCLSRGKDGIDTTHSLVCDLLSAGYPVNLKTVNFPIGYSEEPRGQVITDLPHYPWNHQTKLWCEPRNNKAYRQRSQAPHDLLGSPDPWANPSCPAWRNIIKVTDLPWAREHMIQSNMVYPGAGFICMAIEAASQFWSTSDKLISRFRLRDIDILQALVIPDGSRGIESRPELRPSNDKAIYAKGWREFVIHSVTHDNHWVEVCRGLVTVEFDKQYAASSRELLDQPAALDMYRSKISPQDVYASMRSVGIYHGPIFQNLKSIRARNSQSVATITIPDTAASMPYHYQREHVIHPTTLDSVIQSAYTALSGSRSGVSNQAFIPRSIKSMWIANDIQKYPGHMFYSYASLLHQTKNDARTTLTVLDFNSNEPVIRVDGFTLQTLGNATNVSPERLHDTEKLSIARWGPDISFDQEAYLKKELELPLSDSEAETMLELKRVSFYFIQDALSSLTDTEVTGLAVHFQKYYQWMKDQNELAQNNKLAVDSSTWASDSARFRRRFMAKVKTASVNGELVCRLGPSIVSIMRREKTIEQLVDGDSLLNRYHAEAIRCKRSRRQLGALVRHAVHKHPRAKILEIGAGTGLATSYILNGLGTDNSGWGPLASSYDFTNRSSDGFEDAKQKFQPWNNLIRYQKLDIGRDTAKQGFELASYDLIVASLELQSEADMKQALRSARHLLKPSGRLFLMEMTNEPMDITFAFGLQPVWWTGQEEARQGVPGLSPNAIDCNLRDSGFSGVDVDIHDSNHEDLYAFSVITTTALDEDKPANHHASTILLITSDDKQDQPPQQWIQSLTAGLTLITGASLEIASLTTADPTGKLCVYLGDMTGSHVLGEPVNTSFEAVRRLCTTSKGILWITRGGCLDSIDPESAMAIGLLRSIREEYVGKRLVTLDLDPKEPEPWSEGSMTCLLHVFEKTLASFTTTEEHDLEFAERDGTIHVVRYYKDVDKNQLVFTDESTAAIIPSMKEPFRQPNRVLRMYIGTTGLLDTITYRDDPDFLHGDLPPDHMEVEPRAFGVNFRDVMVAMGQLGTQTAMGFECAGVVTRVGVNASAHGGFKVGDRIATMLFGNYSSLVQMPYTNAAHIPDSLSFEVAASMPMVFATAYIALFDTARLQKDEKILIHAATGGVGQAAIILAKHIGAKIYATVGSLEKKTLLIEKYGIDPSCIFSSRDLSFGDGVRSATGGQGVDVVLNSLSGPLLQEGFNCLKRFGRFVEIGKRDLEINSSLELATFGRCVSFSHIDLAQLSQYNGAVIHRTMREVMRLFDEKLITAVTPLTVYPLSDLEKTFRLMQAGKHVGKIVISVDPDQVVPVQPKWPTAKLRPDASYVIVGGLGGIGQSVCFWMAEHGAKNLIVMSRSAGTDPRISSLEREISTFGTKVKAVNCDISNKDNLTEALASCQEDMPAVRGVVQGAMLLRDSIFDQMTHADYLAATAPKVQGTFNLHRAFERADLDFFIMLSSIVGVMGNLGQANYSAGGAYQDALAAHRLARGQVAASIDIGVVRDIGYVAEHDDTAQFLIGLGHRLLNDDDVFRALEYAVAEPRCGQLILGLNTGPGVHWEKTCMGRDPRFGPLRYRETAAAGAASDANSPGNKADMGARIAQAGSLDDAAEAVVQGVKKKLMEIFMIGEDDVDVGKGLSDHGVDSLVAVELRNLLALRAGAEVSIFEILQSPTIKDLGRLVAAKSSHLDASLVPA